MVLGTARGDGVSRVPTESEAGGCQGLAWAWVGRRLPGGRWIRGRDTSGGPLGRSLWPPISPAVTAVATLVGPGEPGGEPTRVGSTLGGRSHVLRGRALVSSPRRAPAHERLVPCRFPASSRVASVGCRGGRWLSGDVIHVTRLSSLLRSRLPPLPSAIFHPPISTSTSAASGFFFILPSCLKIRGFVWAFFPAHSSPPLLFSHPCSRSLEPSSLFQLGKKKKKEIIASLVKLALAERAPGERYCPGGAGANGSPCRPPAAVPSAGGQPLAPINTCHLPGRAVLGWPAVGGHWRSGTGTSTELLSPGWVFLPG